MFFSRTKLLTVIFLLGIESAYGNCNGGSWSIAKGTTYTCCSPNHNAVGYTYTVDGGTHDDNIKFTVENDEGTVILDTGGTCDITNSGTQCSGSACTSASNNNCYRKVTSGIEAQKVCVKMDCENWSADCNVNAWTVAFYVASVASPPPTSTTVSPPSPPPTAASPPPPPACPTSSAECDTACDATNYKNGHSWSSSSSSGGSCTCYDSSMNTYIFNDCVKSSPPPPSSSSSSPPPPASTTSPPPTTASTTSPPPPAASAGLTSDAPNSLTLYLSWVAASIMLMFAC